MFQTYKQSNRGLILGHRVQSTDRPRYCSGSESALRSIRTPHTYMKRRLVIRLLITAAVRSVCCWLVDWNIGSG